MPRLGLGSIDVSSLGGVGQDVVTTIDDFFFESHTSGEINPMLTTSRTNLIPNSEFFESPDWAVQTGITITNNFATAPDGTQTAAKIIGNGSTGLYKQITIGSNATVARSVFLKSISGNINVILKDPVLTVTQKTLNLTTEWQRFDLIENNTHGSTSGIWIDDIPSSGIYMWGAQLEVDGFVSSYIPTSGSAVTVSTTLNDTSEVWDFDSTDITLEADPEDEGFWEEGSNLVLNHDYADLGSEEVTNGDFAISGTPSTDTYSLGWYSNTANVSITNGTLILTNSALVSSSRAYITDGVNNTNALTINKFYKLQYDVVANNGVSVLNYYVGGSGYDAPLTVGTHIIYFESGSNQIFQFRNRTTDSNIVFDNISIKQVDPNDRWTLGTGWSIEDGKAKGAAGTQSNLTTANNPLTVGDTVEITYTISDYVAGSAKAFFGGGLAGTARTSNGTFTEINVVTTNGSFLIQKSADGNLSIDNVTVREYAIQPQDV